MSTYEELGVTRQLLVPRFGQRYHVIFAEHDAVTRLQLLNAFNTGLPLPENIPFVGGRECATQCWQLQYQDEQS